MSKRDEWEVVTDKTDEKLEITHEEPKDRFYGIYVIFFFIGIGTLLPWNFFITADSYFKYQLRNRSLLVNENPLAPEHRTNEQKMFANNIALCTMIPLAFTNFANLILKEYLSAPIRVFSSSLLVLCMFIITVILTKVTVETYNFFVVTLASVVFINIGSSIVQGSTYGILSMLPASNARGYLEGQAVAGITAAVANLITISVSADWTNVGFIYFLVAVFIISLTFILFILLFRSVSKNEKDI
uniref:Equilibrative nucleoside transporter 3 n=1 Tax=Schistocephalus solidus TaxID=70667 RepID=A0A0V0J763_SCHSO